MTRAQSVDLTLLFHPLYCVSQYYRIDFFADDYDVQDVHEPQGFLGETLRPQKEQGILLTETQDLKAESEDYMVAGAFSLFFITLVFHSLCYSLNYKR